MARNSRRPRKVSSETLLAKAGPCSVLIVAAGFETRAHRVLELLTGYPLKRVILVEYPDGIPQNGDNLRLMLSQLASLGEGVSVLRVTLDPRRPDDYLIALAKALQSWRPDVSGEVWLDITALPMQGICATLAAVRGSLPNRAVRVLYTEAAEYFPTKVEVMEATKGVPARGQVTNDEAPKRSARRSDNATSVAPLQALSQEMSGNLIPKTFGGSSTAVSTCLIVFAGYEKHRSIGVVDELNPSRLVLVFGQPARTQLQWRTSWSRKLHEGLQDARPTSSEIVSTLDPLESLRLLNLYYAYLFADHNIAVSPICSKMQCVACYLFWERYRDVQLVFPIPVTYLPYRFSVGHRHTFEFVLPSPSEFTALAPAPL